MGTNYKYWILVRLTMSKIEAFIILWFCFFFFADLILHLCGCFWLKEEGFAGFSIIVMWFHVVDFRCLLHLWHLLWLSPLLFVSIMFFVTFLILVCGSGLLFICFGNDTAGCFWNHALCLWLVCCLWYIWLCPWILVLQLFMIDLVVSYYCLRSDCDFGLDLVS